MMMTNEKPVGVALLGCTGSIGTSTLEVLANLGSAFRVVTLAAGRDGAKLAAIAAGLPEPPALLALGDPQADGHLPDGRRVPTGEAALVECATHPDVDLVVMATVGQAGFAPTLAALAARKQVALANKEALVMAGELVTAAAQAAGVRLRPIDSEHSAIWQCLQGETGDAVGTYPEVERLLITASGGPFRTWTPEAIAAALPAQALKHPNWNMGAKITVDSASLMNKGLEIIEAHWLFNMPYEQISVVVHPESIIHSMVTFRDGSTKAQLGLPTMRVPIQYALTWPHRAPAPWGRVDWPALGTIHFEPPDFDRFPCLRLAGEAARRGGTFPTVLAAADEEAVAGFLAGRWPFGAIARLIDAALTAHESDAVLHPGLDAIRAADTWARQYVQRDA
jgi:1-deoxy-D-xylulose-5-phosphate reductoisomerase